MTCTQAGCRNVQCYVCHKTCDYAHFNDPHRGGKTGNCPLFDSVEDRHIDEVRRAEEEARRQAQEDNPDVNVDLFEIRVSDKVKEDEERRRQAAKPPAAAARVHAAVAQVHAAVVQANAAAAQMGLIMPLAGAPHG